MLRITLLNKIHIHINKHSQDCKREISVNSEVKSLQFTSIYNELIAQTQVINNKKEESFFCVYY